MLEFLEISEEKTISYVNIRIILAAQSILRHTILLKITLKEVIYDKYALKTLMTSMIICQKG